MLIYLITCITIIGGKPIFKHKFHSSFALHKFILIVIFSFVGLYSGAVNVSLKDSYQAWFGYIGNIIYLFLFLFIIYNSKLSEKQYYKIFYKSTLFISFICGLSILSNITGLFDFTSPPGMLATATYFSKTALGGLSTGYSNNLSLFIPFFAYYSSIQSSKRKKYFVFVLIGLIILSQVISGGRGGLFASLIAIIVYSMRKVKILILFFLLLMGILYSIPKELIIKSMRAEYIEQLRNQDGSFNQKAINRLTSGRTEGYAIGIELFKERPLLGTGFNSDEIIERKYHHGYEVHNLWLKNLVEGGLLFFFLLLGFFYSIIQKAFYNIRYTERLYYKNKKYLIRSLVVAGLFITMLEPNFILGTFQNSILFWGIIIVTIKANRNYGY